MLDKSKLQIFSDHAQAAVESMANALYRTAFSTFVKETEDFTAGLTSATGQTFASPTGLGSNWFVGLDYKGAIDRIADYEPGDIGMTNEPYAGFVCTHSPDIHLWKPIFSNGQIVAFAVGHVHNTDVGGAVPASLSRSLTDIQQEGIRIPPCKLFRKGILNQEIVDVLLNNVRVRDQNWGDLKALVAAMNTGEARVLDLIARFGHSEFLGGVEALLDYAESQARSVISSLPDGRYDFHDYIDEDSPDGLPCRLALTLTIAGDSMELDFRGSDPQLYSSINLPSGGLEHHTLLLIAMYMFLHTHGSNMMINTGTTRAFRCLVEPGSVLHPEFPAAVGMRSLTALRLQDVIFGCLSQALGGDFPAAGSGSVSIMNVLTTDPTTGRRVMAAINPILGGAGGGPQGDGIDGAGGNAGYLKNTPVEVNEAEVPIEITEYRLQQDSGGAGRYRGGLGVRFGFRTASPQSIVTARNRDRTHFRPWGAMGGSAGGASNYMLNPGATAERVLGNTDVFTAQLGDVVVISSSGGGGWGDPFERSPQAVLDDVRRGAVSIEQARQAYGVAISGDSVDEKATSALRSADRTAPEGFDFGPERAAYEAHWSKASYDRLISLLTTQPASSRFFIKHRVMRELADEPSLAPRHVENAFAAVVRALGA